MTNNGTDTVSVVGTDTRRVTQTAQCQRTVRIAMGAELTARAAQSSAYDAIAVIDAATNTALGTHPLVSRERPGTLSPTTSTCRSAEMALAVLTLRCWTRRAH